MTITQWWRDLRGFRTNARSLEYWRQRAIDQEREWTRLWKEIQEVRGALFHGEQTPESRK